MKEKIFLIVKKITNKLKSIWKKDNRLTIACKGLKRKEILQLLNGYIILSKTGITTPEFSDSLITTYAKTNGKFQEFIFQLTNELNENINQGEKHKLALPIKNNTTDPLESYHKTLSANEYTLGKGSLTGKKDYIKGNSIEFSNNINKYCEILNQQGYLTLPFSLDPKICNLILNKSKEWKYRITKKDDKVIDNIEYKDIDSKSTVTALANQQSLVDYNLIKEISCIDLIMDLIHLYLGKSIYLKNINLWHTFPSSIASSESAQLFHYDQASIKWLKVFIYLSDVGEGNGPHEAILGSHKPNSKPKNLLRKGYIRHTDMVMNNFYDHSKFKRFKGSIGTIFFGDTRCWHKGNFARSGNRSLLQYEYTNCHEQNIISTV